MSTYSATVRWIGDNASDFSSGRYSRAHEWMFDGGTIVRASASPHVVPAPWSDEQGVDPEEAFVASLSSCHMLFFIDFARRAGLVVESYVDRAEGILDAGADGRTAMTRITLQPQVQWSPSIPAPGVVEELHRRAHEACFIANSVRTEVTVIP